MPAHPPAKIAHVITGLHTGGAETMLAKVLAATDRERFLPTVYSLIARGPIADRIEALGIEVHCLGMKRGVPDPAAAWQLWNLLRSNRPHLVQTWMIHADLLGGAAARPLGIPVVWNIRHGSLDPETGSLMTRMSERACALLSRWLPKRIVCASEFARRRALSLGFPPAKLLVIPNGFDLSAFRPDPDARLAVRAELGLAADTPLAGLVGRFDPVKDHATFFAAASRVAQQRPDVHFLLCGQGVDPENAALRKLAQEGGIAARVHLLGRRTDIPRLQAALDVACSSSISEGFPNVLGEAMACGVPCAVTDAGDSAEIVGETGRVSKPRDPEALAANILALLEPGVRERLGSLARERVRTRYDIALAARRYQDLHQELIDACAA